MTRPFEDRAAERRERSRSSKARLGDEDECIGAHTRFMNTLVVISSFFSFCGGKQRHRDRGGQRERERVREDTLVMTLYLVMYDSAVHFSPALWKLTGYEWMDDCAALSTDQSECVCVCVCVCV